MEHRGKWVTGAVLAVAAAFAGCDEAPPAEAPAEQVKPPPGAPSVPEEATRAPVIEEPTFRLALADAGAEGLELRLEARGGYHINQEFPFEAKLRSDSAALKEMRLDKSDAAEFGEQQARFPIAADLPAGEHEVVADVRFAVCTEETCIPDQRTLALTVQR